MDVVLLNSPPWGVLLLLFMTGCCVGSFLNVCIYRIPNGESIVFPGSHCPGCNTPIRFYDNIPIVSYLLLRARCRGCGTGIALRYPMVEALTGILTVYTGVSQGLSLETLVILILIYTLVVISFIDLDHQIIPDLISLPGTLVFSAAAYFILDRSLTQIGLGILAGAGLLYGVSVCYYLIRKTMGMGGGDIKLMAMMGGILGMQGALFTIFCASFLGAGAGVIWMVLRGGMDARLRIPFGPFLAMGALIYLFWGPPLLHWYVNLLR